MFQVLFKGGPVMLLLLLCSFVGLSIIVQKFLHFRQYPVNGNVISLVKRKLDTEGRSATLAYLQRNTDYLSAAMVVALQHFDADDALLASKLEECLDSALPDLERYLPVLNSIITVAPLLGLLGTVLGLMDIFNVISGGGIGDAQQLSGGIAEALVTTVAGLSIAIPFIFAQQSIQAILDRRLQRVEAMVHQVVNYCRQRPDLGA